MYMCLHSSQPRNLDIITHPRGCAPARAAKTAAIDNAADVRAGSWTQHFYPGKHLKSKATGRRHVGKNKATKKRQYQPTVAAGAIAGARPAPAPGRARRTAAAGAEAEGATHDEDAAAALDRAAAAPQATRAAVNSLGLAWSSKAWICTTLVLRVVQSFALRSMDGSGIDARASPRLYQALDVVWYLIKRAVTAYCAITRPGERHVATWEVFLYAHVVPQLEQRQLWPQDQNLWLVGADALLRVTPAEHPALPAVVPPWPDSVEDARLQMLAAGMGPDTGPPHGLRPEQHTWLPTNTVARLTLPPAPGFPLPTSAEHLCGFFPCMLCADPVRRSALRFFMRTQNVHPRDYHVYLYTGAPMFFVVSGATLPGAALSRANDGRMPGTVPFCGVTLKLWREDGSVGSVLGLQIQKMSLRYASDWESERTAYLVLDGADSHAVVRIPSYFDHVVNHELIRVVHELVVCDCSGSVAMFLATLRRAAAGADAPVGDLKAYVEAVLNGYRHCRHTQLVQANMLATDHHYQTPLDNLRCIARRSTCCADGTCGRGHMGIFLLPLRLANGEAEHAPGYSLFAASVGRDFKVLCWDGEDSWAFLTGVSGYPGLARCKSADCPEQGCTHEREFLRLASEGQVTFPGLRCDAPAPLAGLQINLGDNNIGVVPGGRRGLPGPGERVVSTTPIPPRLPAETVIQLKVLDLACARWLTRPGDGFVHVNAVVDGGCFQTTNDGMVLWDLSCNVPGCMRPLQTDRDLTKRATLHTRYCGGGPGRRDSL